MEDKKETKKKEVKEEVAPVTLSPKKEEKKAKEPEKDTTNVAFFKVGDEVKIKDLDFVVKEVLGIDLILARKDFR